MIWRPPSSPSPGNTALTPELSAEMTASDIVYELENLRFGPNEFRQIKIDEPVRDYLITRLATRRA
jgi:hypothetical protein